MTRQHSGPKRNLGPQGLVNSALSTAWRSGKQTTAPEFLHIDSHNASDYGGLIGAKWWLETFDVPSIQEDIHV